MWAQALVVCTLTLPGCVGVIKAQQLQPGTDRPESELRRAFCSFLSLHSYTLLTVKCAVLIVEPLSLAALGYGVFKPFKDSLKKSLSVKCSLQQRLVYVHLWESTQVCQYTDNQITIISCSINLQYIDYISVHRPNLLNKASGQE